MGNFEKLVVLTVLFLSAIVLAVSLSGSDDGEGQNPLSAAERSLAGDDVARGSTPGAGGGAAHLTLAAQGSPESASGATAPAEPPAAAEDGGATPPQAVPPPRNEAGHPRVLKTLAGLSPTALPDYKVYTAVQGDTWSGLADRFYQSGTYVALLRAANEDLERPSPGETIYVPVYDFRVAPEERVPREARPARELAAAPQAAKEHGTYAVLEGDSLWRISQKVYGSGARWEEIFDANRNVLSDASALRPGMTLRIPR